MNRFCMVLLAGAGVAVASTVWAQNAPEQRADTAQAQVTQVAQLFGESDEEKAARLQHEQNQDASIAELNNRVSDLEASLRNLTGQVEQLDHRLAEMNTRLQRMQKDYDYKLCTLAAQQLGASTDPNDPNALPCAGGTGQAGASPGASAPPAASVPPPSTPMPQQGASAAPVHLAPPPGVLGTLPASEASSQNDDGAPPSGVKTDTLASIDTRAQFDGAMKLLSQAQYDEARAQFSAFAAAHPQDDLAPQAVFWIGNIAYVQKDYPNASRSFAEDIKKYPTSPRAPEAMLKLGQSLIAMNQKKEGCAFLGALHEKYPAASKAIATQALAARKSAGCH